ncbi:MULTISPECIES: selenium cofactor biosynthesis protein YqeC [Halorussus]|uniref:selenium cofactor biosynthesis protein YqeC n=1 Tax=Halorussus TaxID=1070314 RepID=UPI00209D43F7|nr:selenium cofactor biosynthesis protein YqeC [Halorussus vallis]USZ77640.1 selenium cofactor biosynthesis protein YqeC [Halorussus vallis]
MTKDLADALDARELTCMVGAGGKKTTLYALADRLSRAVVTATVRIPIFDGEVADLAVTDEPVSALSDADADSWPLGLVPERERPDRYRGYDPETVAALADAHAGPVLVKADGARTRWLKAPDEREPQVPAAADTVVPIASAKVVGERLSAEHVHRPEVVAELTGRELGDPIRPEDVAAVLAHEAGGLKGVPADATAVPVVNMVDDADLRETAREVADEVLDRTAESRSPASDSTARGSTDSDSTDRGPTVPRVVLAQMVADDPVVEVVE